MKRVTLFLIALATISFTSLFSGCGQSGPLYVPGNPSQMAVPPANDAENKEEQAEEADSSTPE
jgi:predicted small lipoprotein YifL